MNQSQRDYLVSTIRENKNTQIKQLKDKLPKAPSLEGFLSRDALRGTLKMREPAEIIKYFEKRAMDGERITDSGGWRDEETGKIDKLPALVLFEEPESYKHAMAEWKAQKFEIDVAIKEIETNYKQLELRLKVASNKVLENVTAQVDDMGDIDLLNMTLAGEMSQKLLK